MDRWKVVAVLGWSLVGVVLLAGAGDKKDTVLARKVVIHDSGGKPVLMLGEYNGKPYLHMFEPGGEVRLSASLDETWTPRLTMSDAKGEVVTTVVGYPKGARAAYRGKDGTLTKLP